MKDQVLTIEQMNILISKGVDVSKASVYWVRTITHNGLNVETKKGEWFLSLQNTFQSVGSMGYEIVPTLDVGKLMEMLPSGINDDTLEKCEVLEIYPCRIMGWTIMYRDRKQTSIRHSNKSLVTALFDTINSLLLCGYKLNNQT